MSDSPELKLDRLRWAGPLTVLASALAVTVIRAIAVAMVRPDARFLPLNPALPVFDSVVFASAAVLLFGKFCRYNAEPIREYRRLAARILLISFAPDILIGLRRWFRGGWPEAIALMAMHVAVWGICVTLLPAAVAVKNARGSALP
jgi:hypothetical protein